MDEHPRRRRRVLHPQDVETPAVTSAVLDAAAVWPTGPSDTNPTDIHADQSAIERGLRSLVGSGSSQISISAALRARDAARPRVEDLARSEAELNVIRRHWTPRE